MRLLNAARFSKSCRVPRLAFNGYRRTQHLDKGIRGCAQRLAAAAFGIMTKALGDYHRLYHDVRIQLREEANAFVTAAVKQNEVELGVASLTCDAARLPLDDWRAQCSSR
jgi:hypothetical protein